jgi:hypothetical protein
MSALSMNTKLENQELIETYFGPGVRETMTLQTFMETVIRKIVYESSSDVMVIRCLTEGTVVNTR